MTLIIFLGLCIIEAIIVWMKVQEIQDAHTIGSMASKVMSVDERYDGAVVWIIKKIKALKSLMWIGIALVLGANLILAMLISVIVSIISLLFK